MRRTGGGITGGAIQARVRVRVGVMVMVMVRVRVRVRVRGVGTYFHTHVHARQGCQACQKEGGRDLRRERASRKAW